MFNACPGATSSPTCPGDAQIAHECGICGKVFDQRISRDRHKRRCVQNQANPRRSKRKSCLPCAHSKLGCHQERPSCSRCVQRGIACQYTNDSGSTQAAPPSPDSPTGSASQAFETARLGNEPPENGATTPGSSLQHDSVQLQIHTSMNLMTGDSLPASESSPFTPLASSAPEPDRSSSSHTAGSGVLSVVDPSLADLVLGKDFSFENLLATASLGSLDNASTQGQAAADDPMSWQAEVLWNHLSSLNSQASGSSRQPPPQDASLFSFLPSEPPPFTQSSQWPGGSGDGDRSKRRSSPFQLTTDTLKTDEELTKLTKSYLQLMINKGPHPPFIHPRIYRCGEGDIPESLSKALCCISAHNASFPSSHAFVDKLISCERDRIIKSFSGLSSDIEMLSAIHSMIVYQVLGFFSGDEQQERSAVLQNPFLLKMARQLSSKFRHHLMSRGNTSDEVDRDSWIMVETVRRTIFFVQVINALSCCIQVQNPYFYESLGTDIVLDTPLPAPSAIWAAPSFETWIAAKWASPPSVTMREVRQRRPEADVDRYLDSVDEFTKLILAVVQDN